MKMEGDFAETFLRSPMQEQFMNLDEYQTMRWILCDESEPKRNFLWKMSLHNLQECELEELFKFGLQDISKKVQESKDLRQQGNRLFTAKGGKRNILGACRLYTDAIYAALGTKSVELAFGFANRAAGLQAFGYFRQAYDDCVCALITGYPESLRYKILTRQAYCSIKMRDLERAEKHLNELQTLTLNASCSMDVKELLKDFDELKNQPARGNESPNAIKENCEYMENQEIITGKNGRRMQAKRVIEKNQLVFTERASAFAPYNNVLICYQCGTTNLIPIPCLHCHGVVNYCSLKCREENVGIHVYLCPAYRFQFFTVAAVPLPLTTILDNGLFTILDELKLNSKSSTNEVWRKLDVGGDVWKNENIPYAKSLRMSTHFNEMSHENRIYNTTMSYIFVVYLKHYTKYYEVLNARNGNIDWKLLTGTLLLRHISQFSQNPPIILKALAPEPDTAMTTSNHHMLDEFIWSSAWHLKLGCLHYFAGSNDVADLNLPYLSQCNHSCVPLFATKFSGRFVSAYALRNLKKGEEITKCYTDYRNVEQQKRHKILREMCHIDCRCKDCLQKNNECVEYNKVHQYRCDNIKCEKIFTPKSVKVFPFGHPYSPNIFCTVCGQKQTFKWHHDAKYLMCREDILISVSSRRRLYQIFKESEYYLVGLNMYRYVLAQALISKWFMLLWTNVSLNDQDFSELVDMLKFVLNVTRQLFSVNSIEYVGFMTYLWDIIAKRKYKCSKADMDEMLSALNIISDDFKVICLNYFNDYIKEYYKL